MEEFSEDITQQNEAIEEQKPVEVVETTVIKTSKVDVDGDGVPDIIKTEVVKTVEVDVDGDGVPDQVNATVVKSTAVDIDGDGVPDVAQVDVAEIEMTAESEDGVVTPEDVEHLEDIEQKRSIINNDADKHRRLRDELNAQTKEWKAQRDALNGQVRELVEEAGKCREERDSLNQKVRETKVLRDEWNQKVSALKEQIAALRPADKNDEKNGMSVKQLKKQLQDLEYTQQTKSLGKDKENEIVKQISTLAREIEEKEKTVEATGEVKEIVQQLRDAKAQAETHHHEVSVYAEQAQAAHDKMIGFYEQADRLRKEADAAQAKFVECKQAADEEHRKHIEQIKSVHEMDKDAASIKNKKTAARKKKVDAEGRVQAKEIFERFKSGEKLSTEDLMALQKSGYL